MLLEEGINSLTKEEQTKMIINSRYIVIKTTKEIPTFFEIISKKGYIKGIYNNSSSIGRTFENELNLQINMILYLK